MCERDLWRRWRVCISLWMLCNESLSLYMCMCVCLRPMDHVIYICCRCGGWVFNCSHLSCDVRVGDCNPHCSSCLYCSSWCILCSLHVWWLLCTTPLQPDLWDCDQQAGTCQGADLEGGNGSGEEDHGEVRLQGQCRQQDGQSSWCDVMCCVVPWCAYLMICALNICIVLSLHYLLWFTLHSDVLKGSGT